MAKSTSLDDHPSVVQGHRRREDNSNLHEDSALPTAAVRNILLPILVKTAKLRDKNGGSSGVSVRGALEDVLTDKVCESFATRMVEVQKQLREVGIDKLSKLDRLNGEASGVRDEFQQPSTQSSRTSSSFIQTIDTVTSRYDESRAYVGATMDVDHSNHEDSRSHPAKRRRLDSGAQESSQHSLSPISPKRRLANDDPWSPSHYRNSSTQSNGSSVYAGASLKQTPSSSSKIPYPQRNGSRHGPADQHSSLHEHLSTTSSRSSSNERSKVNGDSNSRRKSHSRSRSRSLSRNHTPTRLHLLSSSRSRLPSFPSNESRYSRSPPRSPLHSAKSLDQETALHDKQRSSSTVAVYAQDLAASPLHLNGPVPPDLPDVLDSISAKMHVDGLNEGSVQDIELSKHPIHNDPDVEMNEHLDALTGEDAATPTAIPIVSLPPPPPLCHRVPGVWGAGIALVKTGILQLPITIDIETTNKWCINSVSTPAPAHEFNNPKLAVHLLCLPIQLLGSMLQGLSNQSAEPIYSSQMWMSHHKWPPQGSLVIQMNRGKLNAQTWLPHYMGPDSPPLDITEALLQGENRIQCIQLCPLTHIFAVYATSLNSVSTLSIVEGSDTPTGANTPDSFGITVNVEAQYG